MYIKKYLYLYLYLYLYIYIYIDIIAEAERKWIPTIKEVLTNRITAYLKFRHISFKKRYIILFGNATHHLKGSYYKYQKYNWLILKDTRKQKQKGDEGKKKKKRKITTL